MKICVASGKGGTGKTTVAVNLALVSGTAHYMDCDVEEPNGHLFLKPDITSTQNVTITIPEIDEAKCTYCGFCSEVCEFNAIGVFAQSILVYPELCHGCAACIYLCPQKAIKESKRAIGVIETGQSNGISFSHGKLNIGEPLAPPLIKALKKDCPADSVMIIDAPPGTSCPVVATLRGSDYIVLVTEPTPFGLHDLSLAVTLIEALALPAGVVINKSRAGDDNAVDQFCEEKQLPILMKLPFDRRIATLYSKGTNLADYPEYNHLFKQLFERIRKEYNETTADHKR